MRNDRGYTTQTAVAAAKTTEINNISNDYDDDGDENLERNVCSCTSSGIFQREILKRKIFALYIFSSRIFPLLHK